MINADYLEALREALSFVTKDADRAVDAIKERFDSLHTLLATDIELLSEIPELGERGAYFLRVAFALASRRITDNFKFGRAHTEEEILNYFKALYLPIADETVYCMLFDESGRVISCEFISEGTVSSTDVLPRKMLQLAVKKRAASIIIAHNHPAGVSDASIEDVSATERVGRLFLASGKRVRCHYVIAGDKHTKIDCHPC